MAQEDSPEKSALSPERASRHELLSALTLAIATVSVAWAGYQASGFVTDATLEASRGAGARLESSQAVSRASALNEIDVNLWTEWVEAFLDEHPADTGARLETSGAYEPTPRTRSAFYYASFRKEFRPAFHAWLARNPFLEPGVPVPFATKEYVLADDVKAAELVARAERQGQIAQRDGEHGRDYVLLTVLFAASLALAGLGVKFQGTHPRDLAIALSIGLLVVSLVFAATLPVRL
jgi:hypothetical protein